MTYCEWQGQLVSIDERKGLLSLISLQKKAEHDGWALATLKSISFTHHLNCHSLSVILNNSNGLYTPFIMANHTGTCKYELFECNFSNAQLMSRFKYDCLPQDSSSTLIMDGPRVLRCQGSTLIITAATPSGACSPVTYDVQTFFHKKNAVIDRFWAFEWSSTGVDDALLVMARLTSAAAETTKPHSNLHWACFVVNVREKSEPVPVLEYVPHEYGCIATCINCSNFVTVSALSGSFVSQPRFYVGTSFKQVVVFEQGVLVHCVPLETIIPYQIVVMENHSSVAVRSMAGECCAFKLCAEGQNQGNMFWHGTSCMIVGDFANIGHSQLLILHSDGKGEGDNFIATDLHGFSTEQFKNDVEMAEGGGLKSEGDASSLYDTVKAFKLRKHMGDVQLAEMESEVQRKSDLIRNSLSFMKSLEHSTSDGTSHIPNHRPDLICIIPGEMDSGDNQSSLTNPRTRSSSIPTSLLKAVQVWQRWEGGQWIIGLVLKNESKTEISSPSMSLFVSGGANPPMHESLSRVVWTDVLEFPTLTLSTLPSKPPAKRRKVLESILSETNKEKIEKIGSGHKLCVIVSTSLPNWSQRDKMDATVVIGFRVRSTTNPRVGNELAVVSIPVSLCLGQICSGKLNIDQNCLRLWTGDSCMLVDGPNWDEKEHQDLATLLGSQSTVQVSVTTELIEWGQLCSILNRRLPLCGCYSLQLTQTNTSKQRTGTWSMGTSTSEVRTTISSPNKILDGVGICVTPSLKKRNTAIVSILYRLESQLSLVLAVLKRSLPDGAVLGLN